MDNEGTDGRRVEARGRGGQVEQNRCVGLEGPALASCGIRRRMASIMMRFVASANMVCAVSIRPKSQSQRR